MREARHGLMPQILHCHVALDDTLGIVLRLMDVGITHAEGAHPGVVPKELSEGGFALDLHSDVIEVEGSRMKDVVGRIHHPVDHLRASVVEAADGCAQTLCRVLTAKREGVIVFGFQVAIALMGRAFVVKLGEGGQAEALVVGEEQLPAGCGTIGDIDARIEAETMVDGRSHACHHARRNGPMAQQDVVFEAEGDCRPIVVPSIEASFRLAIASQIGA